MPMFKKNRLINIIVPLLNSCLRKKKKKEIFIGIMNTQMGSFLTNEKLERNNFAFWQYKMYTNTLSAKVFGATSEEHKKINPTQWMPNMQPEWCIASRHVSKPTKQPHQMWILWQNRPPWRGVLKEEEWVGIYKPTAHQLCHQLRIRQLWWIFHNET